MVNMQRTDRALPYKGTEPYVFISYSHKDAARIMPLLLAMQRDGCRIWFDEGIDPGTEWDQNIADHIKKSSCCIAFLSENYLQSDNCKDELNYVRTLEKSRVLVYLEKVSLPPGIEMRHSRMQAVHAYIYPSQTAFLEKLYEAEPIRPCQGALVRPAAAVSTGIVYSPPAHTATSGRLEDTNPGSSKKTKQKRSFWVKLVVSCLLLVAVPIGIAGFVRMSEKKTKYRVGDEISFGAIDQNNDLQDGDEPIEWVIADQKDGRFLLVSKYALASQPYHAQAENTSWSACSLRHWLNSEFLHNAFTAKEQQAIAVENSPLSDKVFVLSVQEAERYFPSASSRKTCATPSAIAAGAYQENDACGWWLRDQGDSERIAARVNIYGEIMTQSSTEGGVERLDYSVRPAMWVMLGSESQTK